MLALTVKQSFVTEKGEEKMRNPGRQKPDGTGGGTKGARSPISWECYKGNTMGEFYQIRVGSQVLADKSLSLHSPVQGSLTLAVLGIPLNESSLS